jgi:hypothetical protein
MPRPLLFPLNRISTTDVAALQFAQRGSRLLQPAFMRQRPRAYQGLLAPRQANSRPWNTIGFTSFLDEPMLVPTVVHQLLPYPPTYFRIVGTTKDSTGAVLGNCVVDWFDTPTDVRLGTTTSDANGLFEFRSAGQPPNAYYLVAYKAGSPDVAGTTVNTLVGT